jgi:hypothetical protein
MFVDETGDRHERRFGFSVDAQKRQTFYHDLVRRMQFSVIAVSILKREHNEVSWILLLR